MRIKAHHNNSNWLYSSQDWACPVCRRDRFRISRPGNNKQILARLVVHHDHMGEALEAAFNQAFKTAGTTVPQKDGLRLVERIGDAFAAYEEVLICEDCNFADAAAKKVAKALKYFSFSPNQIRSLTQVSDHQPHCVGRSEALAAWQQAKPAYELRMRLIGEVALASVTNSHWYEPYRRNAIAIPLFGNGRILANRGYERAINEWIYETDLRAALNVSPKNTKANLLRWRTVKPDSGVELTCCPNL